jgi:hypothetical protein
VNLARLFHYCKANDDEKPVRRLLIVKRIFQTILMAAFVVLITASFGYAEYVATDAASFPYFHLGCLIVGGMIITSLKHKYSKIYLSEAVGSFALYAVLVALFTAPVIEALKSVVS